MVPLWPSSAPAAEPRVDRLVREGRGWRVQQSLELPAELAFSEHLTYNLVSGEVFYAAENGADGLDLYAIVPEEDGGWSAPLPLTALNTPNNEQRPLLAADGRTLIFFRDGVGWFAQTDRGEAPAQTQIPIGATEFTLAQRPERGRTRAVAGLSGGVMLGELRNLIVSPADALPAGRLAYVAGQARSVALTTGRTLSLHPSGGAENAVFLRNDERLADGNELGDLDRVGIPAGKSGQ